MTPEIQQPMAVSDVLPLARHDLACFATLCYPGFELPPHIEALVARLEAVERGEVKRLMVFMPPRHGKSATASELFPSWYLGRHPERSVITASYSADIASDFGRRTRNHVADPMQAAIFPSCILLTDAQDRFTLTAGGQFWSVGRGSAVTGRGCDMLLIDDPLSGSEEARSESVRKGLKEWYSRVAFTRLAPGGVVVLIQTRWHQDDLAGWLLSEHADEGWEVLSLPAIAEENDPLGRKVGEALWPERYPIAALESAKRQLGSAAFSSLYQQRPVPEGGGIVKAFWFKYFVRPGDAVPEGCVLLPDRFDQMAISMDLAFKSSATSDYVCMGVWGRSGARKFLLDVVWDRLDFVETKRAIVHLAAKWPHAYAKWIERAANGEAIVSELSAAVSGLIPVTVHDSKAARLSAASPDVESGCVFLPHPSIAPWSRDFVEECAGACAGGKHDDAADMLSLAIAQFRQNRGGHGEIIFNFFG
jgi:predicted phage terminase large subunit-like protein